MRKIRRSGLSCRPAEPQGPVLPAVSEIPLFLPYRQKGRTPRFIYHFSIIFPKTGEKTVPFRWESGQITGCHAVRILFPRSDIPFFIPHITAEMNQHSPNKTSIFHYLSLSIPGIDRICQTRKKYLSKQLCPVSTPLVSKSFCVFSTVYHNIFGAFCK